MLAAFAFSFLWVLGAHAADCEIQYARPNFQPAQTGSASGSVDFGTALVKDLNLLDFDENQSEKIINVPTTDSDMKIRLKVMRTKNVIGTDYDERKYRVQMLGLENVANPQGFKPGAISEVILKSNCIKPESEYLECEVTGAKAPYPDKFPILRNAANHGTRFKHNGKEFAVYPHSSKSKLNVLEVQPTKEVVWCSADGCSSTNKDITPWVSMRPLLGDQTKATPPAWAQPGTKAYKIYSRVSSEYFEYSCDSLEQGLAPARIENDGLKTPSTHSGKSVGSQREPAPAKQPVVGQ